MYDDLIWPFQQNVYYLLVVSVATHTNLTLPQSTLLTLLNPIITAELRRELVPLVKPLHQYWSGSGWTNPNAVELLGQEQKHPPCKQRTINASKQFTLSPSYLQP